MFKVWPLHIYTHTHTQISIFSLKTIFFWRFGGVVDENGCLMVLVDEKVGFFFFPSFVLEVWFSCLGFLVLFWEFVVRFGWQLFCVGENGKNEGFFQWIFGLCWEGVSLVVLGCLLLLLVVASGW